jgi:hypothetical protein
LDFARGSRPAARPDHSDATLGLPNVTQKTWLPFRNKLPAAPVVFHLFNLLENAL